MMEWIIVFFLLRAGLFVKLHGWKPFRRKLRSLQSVFVNTMKQIWYFVQDEVKSRLGNNRASQNTKMDRNRRPLKIRRVSSAASSLGSLADLVGWDDETKSGMISTSGSSFYSSGSAYTSGSTYTSYYSGGESSTGMSSVLERKLDGDKFKQKQQQGNSNGNGGLYGGKNNNKNNSNVSVDGSEIFSVGVLAGDSSTKAFVGDSSTVGGVSAVMDDLLSEKSSGLDNLLLPPSRSRRLSLITEGSSAEGDSGRGPLDKSSRSGSTGVLSRFMDYVSTASSSKNSKGRHGNNHRKRSPMRDQHHGHHRGQESNGRKHKGHALDDISLPSIIIHESKGGEGLYQRRSTMDHVGTATTGETKMESLLQPAPSVASSVESSFVNKGTIAGTTAVIANGKQHQHSNGGGGDGIKLRYTPLGSRSSNSGIAIPDPPGSGGYLHGAQNSSHKPPELVPESLYHHNGDKLSKEQSLLEQLLDKDEQKKHGSKLDKITAEGGGRSNKPLEGWPTSSASAAALTLGGDSMTEVNLQSVA